MPGLVIWKADTIISFLMNGSRVTVEDVVQLAVMVVRSWRTVVV